MWFIHGGIFSGTLCNPFPTNTNKDSAAVPELLFIIHSNQTFYFYFYSCFVVVVFLSGLGCFGLINLIQ